MAVDLDSASAICSSHHSWHIGSDSGVESAPILFPEGIWHQADVRLSGYQDPFCYIADLWRSITELWQPLWFGLFSHLAFPVLTEWCYFCHWWYDWDKGWPLPTQFILPARSWRLIRDLWGGVPRALNPAHLGWRHASTWASCACKLCLRGHVGLRDRGVVGLSHRGGVVGNSLGCGVLDTNKSLDCVELLLAFRASRHSSSNQGFDFFGMVVALGMQSFAALVMCSTTECKGSAFSSISTEMLSKQTSWNCSKLTLGKKQWEGSQLGCISATDGRIEVSMG